MKTIAVIGGGITGVTTAYALARRGFTVTLFEKQRYAAMETSFANGGQLSASNAEVWNHWSTIFKGLKWMLKSDAPLLLNPKPSWHKISWFAQFMAAIPNYEKNTVETAKLAIAARDARDDSLGLTDLALRLIERRAGDPGLTPAALAGALDVSLRRLQRALAAKGISASGAIQDQRMQHVRALLRTRSDMTVAACAQAAGFPDISRFTRDFREIHGCPPGQYRQLPA